MVPAARGGDDETTLASRYDLALYLSEKVRYGDSIPSLRQELAW